MSQDREMEALDDVFSALLDLKNDMREMTEALNKIALMEFDL